MTNGRQPSLSLVPRTEPPLETVAAIDRERYARLRAALPCHHPRSNALRPRAVAAVRKPTSCVGVGDRITERDQRITSYGTNDETGSAAIRFAESSLRVVLEVIDGRRQAEQLRVLATAPVLAAVYTLSRLTVPGRALGVASLGAVKISMPRHGTAEIFGRYHRGSRVFAIAACAVYADGRWRLTALRVL